MTDYYAGLEGVRVLAVDDYADGCLLLKALLELYGVQVTAVSSASEAFEVVARSPIDVLIADIAMPDEDGYALMRRIRKLPASQGGRMPAIALTAFAIHEGCQQAIAAGFQAYLTKPIEPDQIVETLVSLICRAPVKAS